MLLLLTCCRQTELVADARRTASTSRRDVPSVRAATPDVQHGVPIPDGGDPNVRRDNPPTRPSFSEPKSDNSNTRTISSDNYRDKQGGRDDAYNQNSSVSVTQSDCRWVAAHSCLELRQVSCHYSHWTRCLRLAFAFSAPGESPPLPNNPYGASSSSRRDVVSEVHRDVVNTQTLIHDIHNLLKGQEGAGSQLQSVSVARILPLSTKRSLLLRLKTGQHSQQ